MSNHGSLLVKASSQRNELGARAWELRRYLGWTQDTLSRRMTQCGHSSWTHGTVALIERGDRHLRLYEGYSLASLFNVPLRVLAWGDPERDLQHALGHHLDRLRSERAALRRRLDELDRLLAPYTTTQGTPTQGARP